jgi:hypothetical protein
MEAASCSETSVPVCQTSRCHIPEELGANFTVVRTSERLAERVCESGGVLGCVGGVMGVCVGVCGIGREEVTGG